MNEYNVSDFEKVSHEKTESNDSVYEFSLFIFHGSGRERIQKTSLVDIKDHLKGFYKWTSYVIPKGQTEARRVVAFEKSYTKKEQIERDFNFVSNEAFDLGCENYSKRDFLPYEVSDALWTFKVSGDTDKTGWAYYFETFLLGDQSAKKSKRSNKAPKLRPIPEKNIESFSYIKACDAHLKKNFPQFDTNDLSEYYCRKRSPIDTKNIIKSIIDNKEVTRTEKIEYTYNGKRNITLIEYPSRLDDEVSIFKKIIEKSKNINVETFIVRDGTETCNINEFRLIDFISGNINSIFEGDEKEREKTIFDSVNVEKEEKLKVYPLTETEVFKPLIKLKGIKMAISSIEDFESEETVKKEKTITVEELIDIINDTTPDTMIDSIGTQLIVVSDIIHFLSGLPQQRFTHINLSLQSLSYDKNVVSLARAQISSAFSLLKKKGTLAIYTNIMYCSDIFRYLSTQSEYKLRGTIMYRKLCNLHGKITYHTEIVFIVRKGIEGEMISEWYKDTEPFKADYPDQKSIAFSNFVRNSCKVDSSSYVLNIESRKGCFEIPLIKTSVPFISITSSMFIGVELFNIIDGKIKIDESLEFADQLALNI